MSQSAKLANVGQDDVEGTVERDRIRAQIDEATANAARGCGQSDVLFEGRLQATFDAILRQASNANRQVVEAQLLKSGFDPDFAPSIAGPGQCSMTGVDVDFCPCGRHE